MNLKPHPRNHRSANALFSRAIVLLVTTVPQLLALPLRLFQQQQQQQQQQPSLADVATSPNLAHAVPLTDRQYTTFLSISVLLVLLGGVFAGLTLGLMGQDEIYLKVISTSGSPRERKLASKVLNLISKGKHWVLVTLLLSNVITNETLPIVLDRCLGGGWQAVVISTVMIVIFGEIIPQSICVRYGLQVGAFFCPFVLALMYVMYPVAYPIALLLDWILGEDHGTVYKKSGLKTLVTLHRTMGVERLTQDEVTIISAVLDLKEKRVSEIMTPIENVFTMSADSVLDKPTVEEIFNAGFSRIPIYLPGEPTNFIGMLLVRVLISYDPEDCLPVSYFPLATLPETSPHTSCLNILNYFQEGKSHMCVVSRDPGSSSGALGVLTLEDVIEELIGEEIVDESDVFVDIHQRIMREQPGPLSKRHITSYLHSLYTNTNRNSIDRSERLPLLSPPAPAPAPSAQQTEESRKAVIPSNLASNPLKVDNPYVTIKKLPELPDPRMLSSPTSAVYRDGSPNYGGTTEPKSSMSHANASANASANANANANANAQLQTIDAVIEPEHVLDLIREHATASQKALTHTIETGESTKVTTTDEGEEKSGGSRGDSSTQLHSPIPINRTRPKSSLDHPDETNIISSSYKATKNGIVESVITVKGVSKTIIEPAKDWDDSGKVVIDEGHNINEHDNGYSGDSDGGSSLIPSLARSRRGSRLSLFRRTDTSASSSKPRSNAGSSSERLVLDGVENGNADVYAMKDTA